MAKLFLTLCIARLCTVSLAAPSDTAYQSLRTLHIIFRHGDRNALMSLGPTDPYGNESLWTGGFGALTNDGKNRMFQFGLYLRERYGSFLGYYSEQSVNVRSSDKGRALSTAECVLAGLYPPQGSQIWNKDLMWQPVPIHTVPVKYDRLLQNECYCPGYDVERETFEKSTEVQKMLSNSTIWNQFKNMTGLELNTIKNISDWHDNIDLRLSLNIPPPSWVYNYYPEWTEPIFRIWQRKGLTGSMKMKKIRCGPMFDKWRANIMQLEQGTSEQTVFLYSGHDVIIINIMQCLGYDIDQVPMFGSTLMLELHQSPSNGNYARLFYRNGTENEPVLLNPSGCGQDCPWDTFSSILSKFVPQSWEEECFGHLSGEPENHGIIIAVVILCVSYSVLVTVLLIFGVCKRHSRSKYQSL